MEGADVSTELWLAPFVTYTFITLFETKNTDFIIDVVFVVPKPFSDPPPVSFMVTFNIDCVKVFLSVRTAECVTAFIVFEYYLPRQRRKGQTSGPNVTIINRQVFRLVMLVVPLKQ